MLGLTKKTFYIVAVTFIGGRIKAKKIFFKFNSASTLPYLILFG
jgi:hypothetical protein